ncbi:siderophore-interacting protein [Kerstersia gyiorum]|uniref:NADPH-dependent ferric siderophore reductase n=2 Tax=Kerstersia gyiorum TaxID=206506 RepID=A0A4Q7M719_9BURK|nr:siderophore-interacting protein [Kerstersia gyiorum]MCO7637690.1 siderophore-interacting protein [Pseudomonas sp. S 311-6]KAB0541734.1 siderophore-interacting protein [Kerstersia gyiorum]MCP1634547.1 NADPH-dependent ferric siderophore reductase [Kerstersia gyiorum]MCP1680438.1 NADPH-dependent ferric siderophore reductase [Kerstersia gyiorum]MCP1683686.1 NADPH-dependent ferric siderophore reductase [Kerstersia gyiorum]
MGERERAAMARAAVDVVAVAELTPHMRRITLGGSEMAAFLQADGIEDPAAWVKVFLPTGEGRAYTIRSVNRRAATLDLDFVMHGDEGPASAWAAGAQVGDRLMIAGPRSGRFELPDDARWVLLAGDATALPAIQVIAETLPAGIKVKVYAEIAAQADRQRIDTLASMRIAWLQAQGDAGSVLRQSLMFRPFPAGPGYIWVAGESAMVKALRKHYLQEREMPVHRVSASGYWKAGEADHRDA